MVSSSNILFVRSAISFTVVSRIFRPSSSSALATSSYEPDVTRTNPTALVVSLTGFEGYGELEEILKEVEGGFEIRNNHNLF